MPDNLEEMENELQNMMDALESDEVAESGSLGEKHEELESIISEIQNQLEFLQQQVDYSKN